MSRFGLGCAVATPVDEAGAVDLPRLIGHLHWLDERGCDVFTLFGTTGEGSSFGLAARNRAIGAVSAVLPPARLVAGVMAASAEEAVAQAMQAAQAGWRGILLAPPFYFRGASEAGIEAWFAEVLRALPPSEVLLYHIPSMTGIGLSPALIGRLRASFPRHVAGVKDSGCDRAATDALLAAHRDLIVLVGDERDLAHAVRHGGAGTICGLANHIPERLVKVAQRGEDEACLAPLIAAIARHPYIPASKALLAHRKGDPAWARCAAPLSALSPDAAASLAAEAEAVLA
jgi:4-hydroxy-tetrahydrodipicolinate synthase